MIDFSECIIVVKQHITVYSFISKLGYDCGREPRREEQRTKEEENEPQDI